MSSFPGVTVRIVDESIVTPTSELNSPTIGAMWGQGGTFSMKLFAYAGETAQGFYYVDGLNDWFSRLYNFYNTYYPGFSATNGVTLAQRDLASNGATGWTDEWYHVKTFLEYGAPCYVTWNDSGATSSFESLDIDVVFAGNTLGASQTYVNNLINIRDVGPSPAFGVISIPSTTAPSSITLSSTSDNIAAVYGEKKQFNILGSPTSLIVTSLAPDVAGCIARTDRESYPWFSPAGPRRGRINNVAGLTRILSEADKATLYSAKVNPVFSVSGEGTLLWGDKTTAAANSTLSSINVARLFIYLKKTLGPIARGVLFEQNDEITRSAFRSAAESVLRQIVASRGISEYKIICDESNNTPDLIAAKVFVADILVKPIPAINFVRLTLTNKNLSAVL
jgi:hypothetical protein